MPKIKHICDHFILIYYYDYDAKASFSLNSPMPMQMSWLYMAFNMSKFYESTSKMCPFSDLVNVWECSRLIIYHMLCLSSSRVLNHINHFISGKHNLIFNSNTCGLNIVAVMNLYRNMIASVVSAGTRYFQNRLLVQRRNLQPFAKIIKNKKQHKLKY